MLPAVLEAWNRSIATSAPFEFTCTLRGADGEYRPFFTRAAPLRDASGRIVQWFGTNTDVSSLEKAEKALRESQEKLNEGLAAGRMVVWEWDLESGKKQASVNVLDVFVFHWTYYASRREQRRPGGGPRGGRAGGGAGAGGGREHRV